MIGDPHIMSDSRAPGPSGWTIRTLCGVCVDHAVSMQAACKFGERMVAVDASESGRSNCPECLRILKTHDFFTTGGQFCGMARKGNLLAKTLFAPGVDGAWVQIPWVENIQCEASPDSPHQMPFFKDQPVVFA